MEVKSEGGGGLQERQEVKSDRGRERGGGKIERDRDRQTYTDRQTESMFL